MNKYEKLGRALIKLINTKKFGEITFNYDEDQISDQSINLTGYSGYDALRLSEIEKTDEAAEFKQAFKEAVKE